METKKKDFNRLKNNLEDWRELLVMLHDLLHWKLPYSPVIIANSVTVFYLLLWWLDLTVVTQFALLLLTGVLGSFFYPTIAKVVFKPEKWAGVQEKHLDIVVGKMLELSETITDYWNSTIWNRHEKSMTPKYCQLFKASRNGIERLEISDGESDKNTRIVTLENCVKIVLEQPPANIINIVTKTGQIQLHSMNDAMAKQWKVALQSIAFKEKQSTSNVLSCNAVIEEDNDLYCSSYSEGIFTVTLIPTDASMKCGLEPKMYTLMLSGSEIQLKCYGDESIIIAMWPYRYIRKYGYRDGKFTFEAGRKCDTGEGTFKLDNANPQDIFRCMSTKMKSMKKNITTDSFNSSIDNNLSLVFSSLEPGSRSPLPPTPQSSFVGGDCHNPFRAVLTSPDISNSSAIKSSIPNKPPRKAPPSVTSHHISAKASTEQRSHSVLSNISSVFIKSHNGIDDANGLIDVTNHPVPLPCEGNRDYECVEDITDAWKKLGIDDVNHTEHITTTEGDELSGFISERSKSSKDLKSKYHHESSCATVESSMQNPMDESYDTLDFFRTSHKVSSGYTTIVPITTNNKLLAQSSNSSDDYEIIGEPAATSTMSRNYSSSSTLIVEGFDSNANQMSLVPPDMSVCRKADDSYLGYGMIRKSSIQNSSSSVCTTSMNPFKNDEPDKIHRLDYATLQKEQQTALKDKESIVMRFAIVEKNLIDLKSQLEQADKREKKMHKEFDMLNDKLKTVKDDKTRISTALDVKTQEHKNSLKDIEKLKIDISSLETKCKWNTVKLRQEIETKNVLEKELQELKNAEINTKTESEDFSVEKIAELKASQITLKHVNLEQANKISIIEQRLENTSKEMHAMRLLLADCTQEKGNLNDELQECHLENLKLQNVVDANVLKIAELQSNLNDLAALRAQLSIANDTNKHLEDQLRGIEIQLSDQAADVARFHQRESELLTLNGELSALNATLQNEISLHKSKSLAMSLENDSVKKTRMDFEINITKLQAELDHERRSRADERIMMARHLAEKSKDCDHYQQRLDQVLGDLEVVKKKNASIVKDLQREIAVLQKSSLKSENVPANVNTYKDIQSKSSIGESDEQTIMFEEKEPSTSKLIERIIRLQHANNRQAEKIDFLENHSSTLVTELQKKTKIVQHYMMKEQSTSMPSGDKNKLYNGIMHAIYGNVKTSDMNLELVLEINKKLQSVLEDTLLKNITLKDNLDTLGLEVDRLTRQIALYKRDNR
ncbi:uncharacterized protein LOC134205271 isoform X4 [Armigeres subalbatus]|uniref:uncharacterized protein LOC134205271 isoform X4 n=1 Tax=Armigeres subalbatus TaxID=124917 RepID=UPI002ED3BE5C